MVEFETVERCGRVHVVKNGVESLGFVQRGKNGWEMFFPKLWDSGGSLLADHLETISIEMDDWYTSAQAAARLVELGAYDSPPSAHTLANLARAGAFPGAFKLRGRRGGGGRGGSWRIPEADLVEHARRVK